MMGLSSYTIRYYDNAGLIPGLERTEGNARLFSDYAVSWLHLVHCLRTTGLPVEQVRHYIRLCQKGDSTIRERGEMIFRQKKVLQQQIRELLRQMEVLKYKENYYKEKIKNPENDYCNPRPHVIVHSAENKVVDIKGARPDIVFVFQIEYGSGMAFP